MAGFETADDVRRVFGGFFEEYAASRDASALAGKGAILALNSTEPEATIVLDSTVDPQPGQSIAVYVDEAIAPAADITLRATAETLDALLRGDLAPAAAIMRGNVKVEGDLAEAMLLLPLLGGLSAAYRAYREAAPQS